jgi:hypothetical protein
MSENRLRAGNTPGVDCPEELTFSEFLDIASVRPLLRAQGKSHDATRAFGRLTRFNRSVRVLVHTADLDMSNPCVTAQRVKWNWRKECYEDVRHPDGSLWMQLLTWSQLDYVTWEASGDPNGTWIKVVSR